MAYRKKQEGFAFTAYGHNKLELPTINVALTGHFIKSWQHGRYDNAHNSRPLRDFFSSSFPMGYMEQRENGGYTLRFPDKRLTLPLTQNGSETSMEARGFYHERRPLQLSRRNKKPAIINDGRTTPGLVLVSWKTMYE